MRELVTRYLADCPEVIPDLARCFEAEWPSWYGPGGPGDARADLVRYASRAALPVGIVGFLGDEVVGFAALKAESISARADLGPWVAAGFVKREHRRRGYGARLLSAVADVARALGYDRIYCGTATAASLLERCGWAFVEELAYHGEQVRVYMKAV